MEVPKNNKRFSFSQVTKQLKRTTTQWLRIRVKRKASTLVVKTYNKVCIDIFNTVFNYIEVVLVSQINDKAGR